MQFERLRRFVTFEQPVETNDGRGNRVTNWTVFAADVPCSIEPLSARELMAAASMQSDVSVRIVLRYLEGLTAAMRGREGATLYNLRGIVPDNRSGFEWITLPCSQGLDTDSTTITVLDGGSPSDEPGTTFDGGNP